MRSWQSGSIVVPLVAVLAACRPAPLTIEQAKQITRQYQSAEFVPPPRTIDDITAILD